MWHTKLMGKKGKKKLNGLVILISLISLTSKHAYGQCPTINFAVQDTVCLGESLNITNSTVDGNNFNWDFCAGDITNQVSTTELTTNSLLQANFALEIVFDGSNWFGFSTKWNSKKVIRLEFGNSLENNPTIVDMGNIGNQLSEPWAIKIIKNNNNWFGFLMDGGSSKVFRLDFGTSLASNPTITEVASGGIKNGGLEVVEDNGQFYIIISETNNLQMIRLGSDITSIPAPEDVISSGIFSGGNLLPGIKLIKQCDTWYGLASTVLGDRVYFLTFGDSPFNNPTIENISVYFPNLDAPGQLTIIEERGIYWAIVITRQGKFYRLELGESLASKSPILHSVEDLTFKGQVQSLAFTKQNSVLGLLSISWTDGVLYHLKIEENCNANSPQSIESTPTGVIYNNSGKFYIELTVEDINGDISSRLDSVFVLEAAKPKFSATKKCISQITDFMDISLIGGKPIIDWAWNFNDPASGANNTSILQDPTHSYTTPGDYSVNLMVTDDCGQVSDTTIVVKIVPENDLQPNFSSGALLCSNDSLLFTDISTFTDDNPVAWSWNFGDPGSAENASTLQTPKHLYANSGTYDVELKVTGISGCEKTIISQINVVEGPSVAYSFVNNCLDNSIAFTNNTTGAGITGYSWDFGDGVTSNLVDPTHTFADAGDYTVMLTVDNALGCNVTNTQTVTVYALPEVAFINELACSNGGTQFFDQTTVAGANITEWAWDFGDGNTSMEKDPIHIYQSSGSFPVNLITTSNFGCTAALEKMVDVIVGPAVDFGINKVCLGEETQFEDLSAITDGTAIASWFWEIDGQVFTEQNPATTFNLPGTYTASLTITSATFCTATITKDVVINPLPVADFSLENACVNDVVQFSDASIAAGDEIVSYSWNFADLGNSSDANPIFTFEDTGNYNIGLTITTVTGCISTINKTITILDRPEGAFTTDVSQGPPPLTVNFQNNSIGADNSDWDFGNGESSTTANPIFTFSDLGIFEVRLVVSTNAGCTDTVRQTINIVEPLMDLALEGMTTLTLDGKTQVSLDIRNNGTLFVDKIEVTLEVGSEATVSETIERTIAPGELIVHPLNISVTNRNSTPYLCATLIPLESLFVEANKANNIFCINLEEKSGIIKPFPNPAERLITVGVILQESQKIIITMHNAIGQPVLEEDISNAPEGLNEFQVDISGVSDGVYWLKLQYGGSEEIFRVFVDK